MSPSDTLPLARFTVLEVNDEISEFQISEINLHRGTNSAGVR